MDHEATPGTDDACDAVCWSPLDEARLALARLLALAASDPRSKRWAHLREEGLLREAAGAASFLAHEPVAQPAELAPGELPPSELDLTQLLEGLAAPHEELCEEYDNVFGLVVSKECPPYETEYCPQTFSVHRSQELADVVGYYAAFGLEPSRDMPERPDHVALELEFHAWLLAKQCHARRPHNPAADEQVQVCRDAQKSFVQAHLAWWLPAFGVALQTKTGDDELSRACRYLGPLSSALRAWVPIERAVLGVDTPTELAAPSPMQPDALDCEGCAAGSAPEAGPAPGH